MSASPVAAPTARQLCYLRALAQRTGTTFTYPASRATASREITRLRKLQTEPSAPTSSAFDETAAVYATALADHEVHGHGASASWHKPVELPAEAAAPSGAPSRAQVELGRYTCAEGQSRRLVAVRRPDESVLVLDCLSRDAQRDARVLARLARDEPFRNARLVCEMYLADERKGRCRRLTGEDLAPTDGFSPLMSVGEFVSRDTRLLDSRGRLYAIRVVNGDGEPQLRWTRCATPTATESFATVTLREVIGALEDYEPARTITTHALSANGDGERAGVACLRQEAARIADSPIVLNRRLREVVQTRVTAGLSMSEIALRCGRAKRGPRGSVCGETGWLARRIGQIPESGETQPTPWVHSDTLALIAREGLGVSPNEVEL